MIKKDVKNIDYTKKLAKGVKITDANADMINEIIKAAEGRARVRTVDYDDLTDAINDIERRVYMIPESRKVGLVFNVDPHAQKIARSYSGIPESTQVIVERRTGGWYLTSVKRGRTRTPSQRYKAVEIPEHTKVAILDALQAFS